MSDEHGLVETRGDDPHGHGELATTDAPGLPEHRLRRTDIDPNATKRA